MEAHETHEQIHHTAHHGHGGGNGRSKRIAIMISVLACLLALVETGVKGSQNVYQAANIEAANLWAFFQAKSIRMTNMRTAADSLEALAPVNLPEDRQALLQKRATDWRAAAQRYDSEPETGEGRKELAARAKLAEERRDQALVAYHVFEYAAAALQIAIVVASASVVSGVLALAFGAAGLGCLGVVLALVGWLAPNLLNLH
ncbi:MAG: DUF4337 domain-containing protein [Rhodospirillaceae bacterium]|nr:DUF4337 domain-containing protein [Rhodospirillales bacterium]